MLVIGRISASCCIVVGAACVTLLPAATPQANPGKQLDQKAAQDNILNLPGRFMAYQQTALYSKMEGYVKEVTVDIGDRVKKGQLLVKLFVPEQEAALKQKQALAAAAVAETKHAQEIVMQSKAERVGAAAQIKETEAGVKLARIKLEMAKSALERDKKLFGNNAISKEDLADRTYQMETAKAALELAEAKVLAAQAALERATAGVGAAEAKTKAAEAHRDVAKADAEQWQDWLQYAKIVAPYDGIVTERDVYVGHFALAPRKLERPLLTVMETDKLRVVVNVPESAATRIKVGNPVIVKVAVLGDEAFKGTITRTSYALDSDSFTLRAEIDLPNANNALRPGLSANVTIMLDPK